jgi:hypothetical protein
MCEHLGAGQSGTLWPAVTGGLRGAEYGNLT